MKSSFFLIFASIYFSFITSGQQSITPDINKPEKSDAPIVIDIDSIPKVNKNSVNFTAPLIVFGSGILFMSSSIKRSQSDWHSQTVRQFTTSIDNYSAFAPNIAAFGLAIVGVKAKHTFRQRMLISAMANTIMLGTVYGLKYTTKVLRPDGSTYKSFPSGHTAFAFTGAQIIHEEYGHNNIIYSVGGYTIGAATGYLRMVNNKHWFSDVLAGAGLGMLSTKLAYKLLPWAQKKVFKNEKLAILPMPLPKGGGISLALNLK